MEYTGLNRDHKLLFLVRGIPVKGRSFGKAYYGCFDIENVNRYACFFTEQ